MSRFSFSLFQSHIDFAHSTWKQLLQKGDCVIDATAGNGHDTLKLSQLILDENQGHLYVFDNQQQAIESTAHLLSNNTPPLIYSRIYLEKRCHSQFPSFLQMNSIKLVVYNLGYLPGGDKTKTSQVPTTLQSLRHAQMLLQPGGVICLTCYPGHEEGAKEQQALLEFVHHLHPAEWSCSHQSWINRQHSPTILLIQKSLHDFSSHSQKPTTCL